MTRELVTSTTPRTILALDLATTSGWAIGEPGNKPRCGSVRFAKAGETHAQISAMAAAWAMQFFSDNKPWLLVYEQPLPPNFTRGKTTLNTSLILMGLPFLIGGLAYRCGIERIETVSVSAVRTFFLGRNMKSREAEKLTLERCNRFGWMPVDHNAADALAIWAYQCSVVEPAIAHKLMPLFGGAQL